MLALRELGTLPAEERGPRGKLLNTCARALEGALDAREPELRRGRAGRPAAPRPDRRDAARRAGRARPRPPDRADRPRHPGGASSASATGSSTAPRSRPSTATSTRSTRAHPSHAAGHGHVLHRRAARCCAPTPRRCRSGRCSPAAAGLHGHGGPLLPARHARRDPHGHVHADRGPGRRPRADAGAPQGDAARRSPARCSATTARCACGRTSSPSPSPRSRWTCPASTAPATARPAASASGEGWVEILGAGMVDPALFGYVEGYDAEQLTGYAWGHGRRADRRAAPRGARHPHALGERPAVHGAVRMRVPVSWLREYVSLRHAAARAGRAAVDDRHQAGGGAPDAACRPAPSCYRVGRVISREQHPDADRLSLCTVDVGDGEPRQIVCGATQLRGRRHGRRGAARRHAAGRHRAEAGEAARRGVATA